MTILNRQIPSRVTVTLGLVLILLAGLAAYGIPEGWQNSSRILSDSEAAGLVGGLSPGACGILVGIGIGILAVGASSVTMGLGGAFLVSVTAHAAAYACLS